MQTAEVVALGSGGESETAPIEWLPDTVLELLLRFLDSKTLVMAVPAVSA